MTFEIYSGFECSLNKLTVSDNSAWLYIISPVPFLPAPTHVPATVLAKSALARDCASHSAGPFIDVVRM